MSSAERSNVEDALTRNIEGGNISSATDRTTEATAGTVGMSLKRASKTPENGGKDSVDEMIRRTLEEVTLLRGELQRFFDNIIQINDCTILEALANNTGKSTHAVIEGTYLGGGTEKIIIPSSHLQILLMEILGMARKNGFELRGSLQPDTEAVVSKKRPQQTIQGKATMLGVTVVLAAGAIATACNTAKQGGANNGPQLNSNDYSVKQSQLSTDQARTVVSEMASRGDLPFMTYGDTALSVYKHPGTGLFTTTFVSADGKHVFAVPAVADLNDLKDYTANDLVVLTIPDWITDYAYYQVVNARLIEKDGGLKMLFAYKTAPSDGPSIEEAQVDLNELGIPLVDTYSEEGTISFNSPSSFIVQQIETPEGDLQTVIVDIRSPYELVYYNTVTDEWKVVSTPLASTDKRCGPGTTVPGSKYVIAARHNNDVTDPDACRLTAGTIDEMDPGNITDDRLRLDSSLPPGIADINDRYFYPGISRPLAVHQIIDVDGTPTDQVVVLAYERTRGILDADGNLDHTETDRYHSDPDAYVLPQNYELGWTHKIITETFSKSQITQPTCGNGVAEGTEQCDGEDFRGETCTSSGFDGGDLACASCYTDFSGCTTNPACGDGDLNGSEPCDGSDPNSATTIACNDLPGHEGEEGEAECLECEWVTTNCTVPEKCGNGEPDEGEECDYVLQPEVDCGTFETGETGTAFCESTCTWNKTDCHLPATCQNGTLNEGEECETLPDGTVVYRPDVDTCVENGFDQGEVDCDTHTCTVDVSGCADFSCGDGIITIAIGEECETPVDCSTIRGYESHTGTVPCNGVTCTLGDPEVHCTPPIHHEFVISSSDPGCEASFNMNFSTPQIDIVDISAPDDVNSCRFVVTRDTGDSWEFTWTRSDKRTSDGRQIGKLMPFQGNCRIDKVVDKIDCERSATLDEQLVKHGQSHDSKGVVGPELFDGAYEGFTVVTSVSGSNSEATITNIERIDGETRVTLSVKLLEEGTPANSTMDVRVIARADGSMVIQPFTVERGFEGEIILSPSAAFQATYPIGTEPGEDVSEGSDVGTPRPDAGHDAGNQTETLDGDTVGGDGYTDDADQDDDAEQGDDADVKNHGDNGGTDGGKPRTDANPYTPDGGMDIGNGGGGGCAAAGENAPQAGGLAALIGLAVAAGLTLRRSAKKEKVRRPAPPVKVLTPEERLAGQKARLNAAVEAALYTKIDGNTSSPFSPIVEKGLTGTGGEILPAFVSIEAENAVAAIDRLAHNIHFAIHHGQALEALREGFTGISRSVRERCRGLFGKKPANLEKLQPFPYYEEVA